MDLPAVEHLARLARDKTMTTFEAYNDQLHEIEADYSAAWQKMDAASNDSEFQEAWSMMDAAGDRDLANLDCLHKWMSNTHEKIVGSFLDIQSGESNAS